MNPRAMTATSLGYLVIWDCKQVVSKKKKVNVANKKPLKLIEVQFKTPFTFLTQTTEGMVVTGDQRGHILFFNQNLEQLYLYDDLDIGPITSISFHHWPNFENYFKEDPSLASNYPDMSVVSREKFLCRPFMISTLDAKIALIDSNGPKINLIKRDHEFAVQTMATHPLKPWLATGGQGGILKLWNYETRTSLRSRFFGKESNITCVEFDTIGDFVAVGFTSGKLSVLDAISLNEEGSTTFNYSTKAIKEIVFSHDSLFMASSDDAFTTTLFCYLNGEWLYIARYRAHFMPIQSIMFGVEVESKQPRLLTLGADRNLVEYDLMNSSKDNLKILSTDRLEQSAVPMCMIWYPPITRETFIITSNNEYKFKLYNATTKMCRKTLLGPTYGSPLRKIVVLPTNDPGKDPRFLVYINATNVGLQMLPVDGNCYSTMSTAAHPNDKAGVGNLCCSFDGKYVFTTGGSDQIVHMWRVNTNVLLANSKLGGEGIEPFYSLIDGGREGHFYKQMEDYFYYSQIRHQGIETMDPRKVSECIPLIEISNMMRALGFYPSEQEIEDMLNEVKFSEYVDTGKYKETIDLEDFIRLYINHRPAFGLDVSRLKSAFQLLSNSDSEDSMPMDRAVLLDLLQSSGENMSEWELAEALTVLLGHAELGASNEIQDFDPEKITQILDENLPINITEEFMLKELLGFGDQNTFFEEGDQAKNETTIVEVNE